MGLRPVPPKQTPVLEEKETKTTKNKIRFESDDSLEKKEEETVT